MLFVLPWFWWDDARFCRATRRHFFRWWYEESDQEVGFATAVALPRSRRPRRPRNRHDQRYHRPKPRYQLVVQEVLFDELEVVEAA